MRILMTTDTVGGVWTFTKQLTIDLLQRGHEVALVSFGRAPSTSQLEWSELTRSSSSGFSYVSSDVPLEWMQENTDAYDLCAPVLLSVVDKLQPDVLLSSQFCFGKLPIPIPRIVVAHSDVLGWARACRSAPLASTPWLRRYVQLVSDGLEGANAVVAPTHWMLTALAASFTLPQHAVVIPNGRTLPSTPLPRQTRALQVVTAGRLWDEAKNLRILQKIDSPVPIFVAGSSEHEFAQAPLEQATFNLLGELNESELFALFRRSAAYVCTSVYEPFGLAPLEAALCGCAVLANDIPSLREVWADSASFFHDERTLIAALQQLTDPEALEAAQARCRARAETFTSSRMTERYLNLFDRLLRCPCEARSSHAA